MQKKTIHRLLGILVVAGLVIILLPLFQSEKETPTETTVVKAPPFPDQPEPVTASAGTNNPITPPNEARKEVNTEPVNDSVLNKDTNATPVSTPILKDSIPSESDHALKTEMPPIKNKNTQIKKAKLAQHPMVKNKMVVLKNRSLDKNGLIKLKNAAWVVQMGSFKNKGNALRLVNQLRVNGYQAFIQQVSSVFGENVRVYVGPEFKQSSARALAEQLEQNLHIRGIVISYKPLTL